MAAKKTIFVTQKQYDAILEAIRYRIADIHKQRHDAESRGLSTKIYDEDEAKFQELKNTL